MNLGNGRDHLFRGRGGRHGDGHHVIDEQGAGHDERAERREVPAGDRVVAATRRVGMDDLAVADRHHGEQRRDRGCDREAQEERAGAGEDQRPEHLLSRVGRGRDRVRREDRERLDLREALAHLLVDRQGPPDEDAADPGEQPAGLRPRGRRGLLGHERALARVAEVLRVRPLDADAPVAELATLELLRTLVHEVGVAWARRDLACICRGSHAPASWREVRSRRPVDGVPGRPSGTACRQRRYAAARSGPPEAAWPTG